MKKMMAAALSVALLSLGASAQADKATERTYKSKCASCHGADGKAETDQAKKMGVKPFSASASKSEADLKKAISDGVKTDKGEMQGYKDSLSAEQIDNLAKYVKTLK